MATPNDPTPKRTPAGKAPAGKAPDKPADKARKPAEKADGAKPAKAPEKAADKPTEKGKKPPKKASAGKGISAGRGGRKIGQVMVDLGFIDDDQLWELLDEAKNTGQLTGQVAIARGLLTEEQLLQALAEQYGLKVVNLQEAKP